MNNNLPNKRGAMYKTSVHLAVSAAEPVAAHGIVGKRTLFTAVGSTPGTLLEDRGGSWNICRS